MGPGDEAEMLAATSRAWIIFANSSEIAACPSPTGHVLYYLDANGRYTNAEQLRAFIDALERSGVRERVLLFEEPFDEGGLDFAGSLEQIGVPLAADESVHCVEDVYRRAEMGYEAMASGGGKTFSLALDLVEAAAACELDCFVADNACVRCLSTGIETSRRF